MISISKLILSVLLVAPSTSFVAPSPSRGRVGISFRADESRKRLPTSLEKSTNKNEVNKSKVGTTPTKAPLPRELTLITMGVFAQMLGEGISLSSLPLYLTRLGSTPLTVGLAISCFSIAQMTFAPILVGLSSRPTIGRSIVLRICLVGAASASLLIASSRSAAGVILGRTLAGVFAACVPVAQAGVTDILEKGQTAMGLSRVSAAAQLGVVVGPAVSAVLQEGFGRMGLEAGRCLPAVYVVAALFTSGVLVQMTLLERAARKEKEGEDEGDAGVASSDREKLENQRSGSDGTSSVSIDKDVTRLAQPILRLITIIVGWTAILSNSIYGLFAPKFMGFQQPQLSATYSFAAVLMVATQIMLPTLIASVGAHLACTMGILAVATGISGLSLVRIQPFHTLLYMINRAGASLADTSTATLVAESSKGREDRSRNLALLTSTRAAARIISPLLSSRMFEIGCRELRVGILGLGWVTMKPGALPFVTAAGAALAVAPLPSLLRRAERRKARRVALENNA